MNGTPHMHNVEIRYSCVVYGDTRVNVVHWFGKNPSEEKLKRLVRRAVGRHDKGTARAERQVLRERAAIDLVQQHGKREEVVFSDGRVFTTELKYPAAWGTDVMRENVGR